MWPKWPWPEATLGQHLPSARDCYRNDRQVAPGRGDECAGTKPSDTGFAPKRALWKEGQRLATHCGFDDLSRIATAAAVVEALYNSRTGSRQEDVNNGYISHLSLDNKGVLGRQVALEEESVGVAGMIGDDDSIALGQVFEALDAGRHASEHEDGSGSTSGDAVSQRFIGDYNCYEKPKYEAGGEDQPAVKPVQSPP